MLGRTAGGCARHLETWGKQTWYRAFCLLYHLDVNQAMVSVKNESTQESPRLTRSLQDHGGNSEKGNSESQNQKKKTVLIGWMSRMVPVSVCIARVAVTDAIVTARSSNARRTGQANPPAQWRLAGFPTAPTPAWKAGPLSWSLHGPCTATLKNNFTHPNFQTFPPFLFFSFCIN